MIWVEYAMDTGQKNTSAPMAVALERYEVKSLLPVGKVSEITVPPSASNACWK